MAEALEARTALTKALTPRGVRLCEIHDVGKIDLRGDPNDRAFMGAVGRALDLLLPTEPCQSTGNGPITALWVGPNQWLIRCPKHDVADIAAGLEEATRGVHSAITDLSDARAVFRLSGPDMVEVLAKGCPLDLHSRTAKPGYVAGSILAKIDALIHLHQADVVDIYVNRSFADYLRMWFEEAGMDCGLIVD